MGAGLLAGGGYSIPCSTPSLKLRRAQVLACWESPNRWILIGCSEGVAAPSELAAGTVRYSEGKLHEEARSGRLLVLVLNRCKGVSPACK